MNPKQFWTRIAKDADTKLRQARKRIKELESAKATFLSNASNGVPIPGDSYTST